MRGESCGPRTIDLDILLFDDVVTEADPLTLPHPRMHERDFVLAPLVELAPDLRHPVLDATIAELAQRAPSGRPIALTPIHDPSWCMNTKSF